MNWRGILGGAIAVGLVALLAFGLSRDPSYVPSPLVGRQAPDFALETLAGDSLRLRDYADNVVLVNFWASWCIPCDQEHPVLVEAQRAYGAHGAQVVGIVYQDTPENARRWLADRGGEHWPNGLDRRSRTAIEYGVRGVPETFFIARDGRVVYRQIGPVPPGVIAALVPRLLADPSVALAPGEQVGTSPGYVRSSPGFPAVEGVAPRR